MNPYAVRAAESKPALQHKGDAETQAKRSFGILVAGGGWGEARPEEVELLLNTIAAELLSHFPGKQLDPIVVSHSQQGPVVLYQKGPANQYQIYLAAKDRRWGEYIYEFSHELFHILANYEYHARPRGVRHQWFEEMLCETVSLYTLRKLSLTWQQSPPRTEWASYAADLNKFTWRALNEPHRHLPENTSFAQWFRENGSSLLESPYLRDKNELVSMLFLPLLEQNLDWQAVEYLNLDLPREGSSFYDYLADWYAKTPPVHRELVDQTMTVFQFHPPGGNHVRIEPASPPDTLHRAAAEESSAGASGATRQ